MRAPLLSSSTRPVRNRPSANRPARIVLMESISKRERPVRDRKEQVTVLRTIVEVAIWVAVLVTMFVVLAWPMLER